MTQFFSNTNIRKDFLRFEMEKYSQNNEVFIAVAFFTNDLFIKNLVDNGCTVKLIVRLGFPTSAKSLRRVISSNKVMIRYYTSRNFHPKLYMFSNEVAFVGSSNLTDGGLVSNQELNVKINSEDPAFEELQLIFNDYWEQAKVLTNDILNHYEQITNELEKMTNEADKIVSTVIGEVNFENIQRIGKKKKSEKNKFEDSLLKRYQEFLIKFEDIKQIYIENGKRKVNEGVLPLRIEIDQFFNWIRQTKACGEEYLKAPTRQGSVLNDFIRDKIDEFIDSDFNDIIAVTQNKYPVIQKHFATVDSIDDSSENELLDALFVINAFSERSRYYGGKNSLSESFINDNGLEKIKSTISYLLHGKQSFNSRITNCIYNDDFKLKHFASSCVQELYGWVNADDIPICNERTFKAMQWLGFGRI
ncbi:phospholipase D-like domain-containing protein [Brevibacillus sp. 179-C9.3 HS]|uniref:phospholipase D-like domain-containing protein n=1 Tax=unclassified Brevibacillus TaxID=2684853 RepID=UPI0039A32077